MSDKAKHTSSKWGLSFFVVLKIRKKLRFNQLEDYASFSLNRTVCKTMCCCSEIQLLETGLSSKTMMLLKRLN